MANMARIKSEFLIFSGFFWFNPTKWRDYAWLLLKLDPRDSDVHAFKGFSLTRLGRHEEAIGCYDNGLKLDPKNEFALKCKEISFKMLH